MSSEHSADVKFEIGLVLFVDIVGYSKVSVNEQRVAIDELTQAVRASEQFKNTQATARLIVVLFGVLRSGQVNS